MPDILLVTPSQIPRRLHSVSEGYSLRPLTKQEATSLEDRLFRQGMPVELPRPSSVVSFPSVHIGHNSLNEYATLAEFALALLTSEGHALVTFASAFSEAECTRALPIPSPASPPAPIAFPRRLTRIGTTQWLRACHNAHRSATRKFEVTESRFLRFLRGIDPGDSLLDLCISLESLLTVQTEIAFRFSVLLAHVPGDRGALARDSSALLADLYELRSKIVHGDPAASKVLARLGPNQASLKDLARRILVAYVLFMSEHSSDQWGTHVRAILFSQRG